MSISAGLHGTFSLISIATDCCFDPAARGHYSCDAGRASSGEGLNLWLGWKANG